MPLKISTFSNTTGGNAFYKAVSHPLAAEKARGLVTRLAKNGPVAVYDPDNSLAGFEEFFPLAGVAIAGVYVQKVDEVGQKRRGFAALPVSEIGQCGCQLVFVAAFDAANALGQIRHLLPAGAAALGFDELRLSDDMLSDAKRYLSDINFATNFAFFRDEDGHHTRLVSANYWAGYGGKGGRIWFNLFGSLGQSLAAWSEPLPAANAAIVIDSREVRARFRLPAFTGQLFMHVIGAAGHGVVKYALDTYGDAGDILSCTHDANSWPSDLYAGLPAPADGEEVVLWVQNSHPGTIAAGEIGLNLMGDDKISYLAEPIAPFATRRLNVAGLLPQARWPQQIEIRAGKHFVRPRYEIFHRNGRRHIAHVNVERSDLQLDQRLAELGNLLGKLYILPAPVLPPERYSSMALPTPMSTAQSHLPLKALVYDSKGRQVAEHSFGNLRRRDSVALDIGDVINGHKLDGGFGHMELAYDFAAGREADGWMHGVFRYTDRKSTHQAETSFGAHIYNTVLTYKGEPQSYKGPPPGLSTRLFLRVGPKPYETMCHLIYPASRPWHETSDTALILFSGKGEEIAKRTVRIRCSGSLLWRVRETFSADEMNAAGDACYVLVRDTTCRLFGYHGLLSGDSAFSLDHMFGF